MISDSPVAYVWVVYWSLTLHLIDPVCTLCCLSSIFLQSDYCGTSARRISESHILCRGRSSGLRTFYGKKISNNIAQQCTWAARIRSSMLPKYVHTWIRPDKVRHSPMRSRKNTTATYVLSGAKVSTMDRCSTCLGGDLA